jgi:putative transposase
VGEGGDEVSVARFIADQRTNYRVPHTVCCALLGVSLAWFYKWIARTNSPQAATGLHTDRDRRRAEVDRAVAAAFTDAKGLHGSPRLHADLRDAGWTVTEETVADSMRRQGLVARRIKRRNGLTEQDKSALKFADLVKRNFTADRPNPKWVGDITEVPTAAGKLYQATVIDLFSRRLLGAATTDRSGCWISRQSDDGNPRCSELSGQPWKGGGEDVDRRGEIVSARFRYHRAFDAVGACD